MKLLRLFMKEKRNLGFNPYQNQVPQAILDLIEQLQTVGSSEEGILRVPGKSSEIAEIQTFFQKRLKDPKANNQTSKQFLKELDKYSIHSVASVFKLFFLEMTDPLLTFDLYDVFLSIPQLYKNQYRQLLALKDTLSSLPPGNRAVAKELFELLYKLSKHAPKNKMTAYNLAVVFAPNLLRSKIVPTLENLAVDIRTATTLVETIILHFSEIFDSKMPKEEEKEEQERPKTNEDKIFYQKLNHGSHCLAKKIIQDSKRGSVKAFIPTNEEIEKVQKFLKSGNSSGLEELLKKNEDEVEQIQLGYLKPAEKERISEIQFKGGKYSGEILNNVPHGKGKFIFGEEFYEGEFFEGKKMGFGRLVESDGSIYEGEFTNNLKNGRGVTKFCNGNSYEGEFLNNKANGYGEYFYSTGATYKGEWKDDLFHGKGIYSSKETRYEGEFKFGKRDGIGCFLTLKGNLYMGNYQSGLMHGFGVYTFHTGDKYEGEFANGKFNGKGSYSYTNGLVRKGIFKDGRPVQEE